MSTFSLLFILSAACCSFTDSAPPNSSTSSVKPAFDKIAALISFLSRGLGGVKAAIKDENAKMSKVIAKINALELRVDVGRQKLLQTINRTSERLETLSRNVSIILTILSYNDLGCTAGWVKRGRMCYRFSGCTTAGCTFKTAKASCVKEGAILASIRSEKVNKFISSMASKSTIYILLGGTDALVEGQWLWGDGSPFTYTNWNKNEPNNANQEHCMHTQRVANDKWNDHNCSAKFNDKDGFVCEKMAT